MANLINVESVGTGPHLLLLHGWGQSLIQMRPLAELLASHFTVHLIDLPGFGLSSQPPEVWSSFQYADRLINFLDEKQIQRCHLMGHSFGGKVAMSVAARFPERVNQLILLAPSGLKRKRSWNEKVYFQTIIYAGKCLKGMDALLKTKIFAQYFAPKFGSKDYRQSDPMMRKILVKSVNEDISEHLSSIVAPTLILWGEADKETPPEMAYRLNRRIGNSSLVLFQGKGHDFLQDCGAHLCAKYVLSFCK